MHNSLGEQIRNYRMRAKMSQLELENKIDAGSGHVSKIELNKITPTKPILDKIIKILNLSPLEIANLLDVNTEFVDELIDITNNLNRAATVSEIFRIYAENVNKTFKLEGGAFYKIDNNWIKLHMLSRDQRVALARMLIKIPINTIKFNINTDTNSPIVQAYITKQNISVYDLHQIMNKFVPKQVSNLIQKATNLKSMVIVPHVYNDECIAISMFGRHIDDNFKNEIQLFTKINNIAAECLYKVLHKS